MNVDVARKLGKYKPSPHRSPESMRFEDGDVIAWRCAECDEIVSEYAARETTCPVDWHHGQFSYTVDDLLAYLWGKGVPVGIRQPAPSGPNPQRLVAVWGSWGAIRPTLLEALEAAVLRVPE